MYKAYKFRLYPNQAQIAQIERTFDACRLVYNHFLEERLQKYDAKEKLPTKWDHVNALKELKEQNEQLKEADGWALGGSIDDLDAAFRRFLGAYEAVDSGRPRFKSAKNHHQSYRTSPKLVAFNGSKVKLPKVGWVKCRVSDTVSGEPAVVTVSRNAGGKYFVSVVYSTAGSEPLEKTETAVGIDCGLRDLVVTSDGEIYENPKWYVKSEKKLQKLQRQLSRKEKGSKGYEEARLRLAKLHDHVANQRRDHQQKLTTKLVRENGVICIENLASAELAGENGMGKSVYDAAWFEIKRELEYKAKRYGRTLVETGKYFPSNQICSACGKTSPVKITPDVTEWTCPHCGAKHDRGVNSAKNILREGLDKLKKP